MRLKIFVFPILLTIIFFVVFSYIKPEYSAYRIKIGEKEIKQNELFGIKQTLENINALSESLSKNDQETTFANEYLPSNYLQERAIDAVNVIAERSGVALGTVAIGEQSRNSESLESVAEFSNVPVGSESESLFSSPPTPTPNSFSLSIQISGSYVRTRQFLTDIRKFNQLHSIQSFSIVKQEKEIQEGEISVSDDLFQADMVMDLFYFPKRTTPNAHRLAIFKSNELDFSPISALIESEGFVPKFPAPRGAGRDNPFIR